MRKKKLFFVAYGGGHMRLLHQVTKQLQNDVNFEIKILGLTSGYKDIKGEYQKEIVRKISDYDFLFSNEKDSIDKYGKMFLEENHNPDSGMEESDSLFYLGMSITDLVQELGREKALDLYDKKKRHAFKPVNSMKRILEYEKPDLLITTTSPKCELASLLAAKQLGIQSIQVIDLFGDNYPVPFGDNIVVLNERVKEKLSQRITTKSKIHAFGQPVLDFTVSEVGKVDEFKTREFLKIPMDRTVLLYSPSRYLKYDANKSVKEELDYRIVNDPIFKIFESLSQEFDFEVLIRPHPNDAAEKFKEYVDSLANCRIVTNEEISLYEAIAVSDLVVAYNSTIMIEAVLSGKLSFPHNYDESEEYHLPELKDKPFIYSKNFKELEQNLKKALKGELKTPTTRDFYKKGSVARIIDLINRL